MLVREGGGGREKPVSTSSRKRETTREDGRNTEPKMCTSHTEPQHRYIQSIVETILVILK